MQKFFSFIRNNYQHIYKVFLFLTAIVLLVLIFPKEGKFKYEFSKGKPWMHTDLYAPFDFAILKSDAEIDVEKADILENLKPYYSLDNEVGNNAILRYNEEFDDKWEERFPKGKSKKFDKDYHKHVGEYILRQIIEKGIIEPLPENHEYAGKDELIILKNNMASEVTIDSVYSIHSAVAYISDILNNDLLDRELMEDLLLDYLNYNTFLDEEKSENVKTSQIDKISLTRGMVLAGEKIISRGEMLSPEKFQVISSLKKTYEHQLGEKSTYLSILLAQILLISIAIAVLASIFYFFRKDIYFDNRKIILILILMIAMVYLTSIVIKYNPAYLYLVPVCMLPVMIRAFFDTRIALYVHLIAVIIIGFLVPNSFDFVVLQMLTGIVAILSVMKLDKRSQFFLTSVWIFISYSVLYFAINLLQEGTFREINPYYFAYFGTNALLALISYPLIFIFEKLFGFITDVTLIELSNTNNKLLRELSLKAPGTFQHSLQVANLAEEAVYEVGGNALLIRTGAMYHDIGKMDMPLYFVENQSTGVNPHDELSYEESARIIIDHVIKGVEKAKKHNLPEQIIDFIRTHHGTRKVEYFYTMQKKENPDEELDEKEFTYHGPIPFSKETAILMMADSVEAASRSLKVYDEEKIDKLVDNIIDRQLETGQFDNSNITLRDITRIKKIFKRKLMTIYHIRIEYPQ
ncbi:HD family phosphohydrolase [Bacteroidota bacterium]